MAAIKRSVASKKPKSVKTPTKVAKTPTAARKTLKTGSSVPLEDIECIQFATWLRNHNIPHAHIANESRSSTKNAMIRGAKLKRMGQCAGVWDYEVYVPIYDIDGEIGEYQLLKIEMKRQRGGGSTTSKEQKDWGKVYDMAGIPCKVCFGCEEAVKFVKEFYREQNEDGNSIF